MCFDDPKQTLASLQRDDPPDAYVLDWDMPCLDGLALFRLLRARGAAVPVLFLQPIFEEAALDAGAVDFVDKSRGPAIVLHRLSLALTTRRDASAALPSGTDRANLQIGELLLSDLTKRATWRGRHVRLSRNEFDVVALLADNAGRDVGYRQIYDVVCGNGCVAGTARTATAPNVRAMVKRIRSKFVQLDPDFAALQNYPGFGYRWPRMGDTLGRRGRRALR